MAIYSFRIKKGKYQLDLSTSDKELLAEQFDLWVKAAGAYAKRKKANECKNLVNSQIKAEEEITKKNIETQLAKQPAAKVEPIAEEIVETKTEKKEATVDKNLDIFYAPPNQESISSIMNKSQSGGFFDNILENHSEKHP